MKLEDCTKDELIYLIRNGHLQYWRNENEYVIHGLLYRSEKINDEILAENELCQTALREYVELLKPYEDKRILDIPTPVIKKADAAYKRYQLHRKKGDAADRKWNELRRKIDKMREGESE